MKEITWKEFKDAPGVIEAMSEVFKKTGHTIKLGIDDNGEVICAAPVKKE